MSCIAIGIDCFAGGASAPMSIFGASLVAWYRADLGISLGTGVSAWADQSGNGNNLQESTGALQPVYMTAGGANGRPYLVGAQATLLKSVAAFPVLTGPFEQFFIVRATSSVLAVPGYLNDFGNNTCIAFQTVTGSTAQQYNGSLSSTVAIPIGTDFLLESIWNGASSGLTVNNTTNETSSPTSPTNTAGANLTLMNYAGGASGWVGFYYETFIINALATVAQRAAVRSYVASFYGF